MPYAQNGEISIYYDTYGESAGPALVFAHGAGGNAASWWQQVPVFSADHHVVAFDHRGFGRSLCPPDQQSAAHYEADVVSVMYVEPGAIKDSGVPGPLKRPRPVVPACGPRIRRQRHWRAVGAGRRGRTLHIFRETRGIQRRRFGVP